MTAELGKANYTPINKLEAGMKVHRDVMGRGGNVLVNAGEVLTRRHLNQLGKWEKKERPQGSALPKKDPKNRFEQVKHSEFMGGWKPSHFNPQGVLVSATLASGVDVPRVEQDPTVSKAFQDLPRKSFAVQAGESPMDTRYKLEGEIKVLESTNAQLGGTIHSVDRVIAGNSELTARKEELVEDNKRIIQELKGNNGKSTSASTNKRKRK